MQCSQHIMVCILCAQGRDFFFYRIHHLELAALIPKSNTHNSILPAEAGRTCPVDGGGGRGEVTEQVVLPWAEGRGEGAVSSVIVLGRDGCFRAWAGGGTMGV